MRICGANECEKKATNSGLCNLHYQRKRVYGDPNHPGVLDRRTWAEKFEGSVEKHGADECWPWVPEGRVSHPFGYGLTTDPRNKRRSIGSHRAAYLHWVGPLKKGEVVMHTCDNPPCCNPRHLKKGSSEANRIDMMNKGRNAKGENHPKAKLTVEQVKDMRRRYARRGIGGETYPQLAKAFGISTSTCQAIVKRRIWRDVE